MVPNSRVIASLHHRMQLFLTLNFTTYLYGTYSMCQALFRHFTNTGLFNPHHNPTIVPISLLMNEEKFNNWPSMWKM